MNADQALEALRIAGLRYEPDARQLDGLWRAQCPLCIVYADSESRHLEIREPDSDRRDSPVRFSCRNRGTECDSEAIAKHLAAGLGALGSSGVVASATTPELLEQVRDFIRRFVVLPSEAAEVALALYVLHTHVLEAAEQTPYLLVVSPERQSGKTRLLEALELLVCRPWRVAGASEAALFRKIELDKPTLLLDEVDAIFGAHNERTEPLRCLLNAGNRRGASVSRVVGKGKDMQVADFGVYCPKLLAGISSNRLPDTLTDRSITIEMQRRKAEETVDRFRYRHASRDAEPIQAALEVWGESALDALQDVEPELPDDLSDRQADAWEPLLAIADSAGWSARARRSAVALSVSTDGDELGYGAQLLAALKAAMRADQILTADLLEAINNDDDIPFGGWREGRGLDARTLARMLKPYGVRPKTVRIGADTAKGYRLADCEEAFSRYLTGASQPSQRHTRRPVDRRHPSHTS